MAFTCNNVTVEWLADGQWYARMTDREGVWATGDTSEEALDGLPSVLREWVAIGD